MRYNPTFYRWSPENTPHSIRNLIWITACTTLLAAVLNNFFHFLGLMGPEEFLGLSWSGIQKLYLWQPLTYLFVQESGAAGIHFLYLITLFINMYLLWLLGTMIVERAGSKHFLTLYFLSGILGGLVALFVMLLSGQNTLITGPGAAILAVCMVWTMYYSESELSLFFLFPLQAKWVMGGVLTAVCLLSLTHLDFASLALYLTGTLVGYLYGLIVLDLKGPFEITQKFDRAVEKLSDWIRSKIYPNEKKDVKIIDLRGNAVIDDDAFVDAMLAKIAKHGEHSLTQAERKRMNNISERKARERMNK